MTRALGLVALLAVARAAAAADPELRAVRLTLLDYRPALRLLVDPSLPAGEVVREGDFVLIRVKGAAADPLPLPKVDLPLEELTLVRETDQSVVKVRIAPEVPFEASHEPAEHHTATPTMKTATVIRLLASPIVRNMGV